MSQDHTLMASRWEMKYLVPQRLAEQIPPFVRQHLELDEFGIDKPRFAYPVHSLFDVGAGPAVHIASGGPGKSHRQILLAPQY